MEFFKNTILVGDTLTRTDETGTLTTILPDYFSLDLPELYKWIDLLPDKWFTHVRISFNDTLPRVAYEAYGNSSYWDVIMLVNKKSPFNCLPYDDDTIKKMAINKVNNYKKQIFGKDFNNESYERLYKKYLKELELDNDGRFIIKIIKPAYIQEFLQLGYKEDRF